jgi:putative DNA primase/helicase
MSQLKLALRYAKHDWRVFQLHTVRSGVCSCKDGSDCDRPGEHPRARHWRRDATTDGAKIRKRWLERPWANIGIVTGRASGIVAIVIDPANGGIETLRKLQIELGRFPASVSWITGNCGMGFIFRHPWPGPWPSKELGPGLKLVADGDYIVAPRSRDSSGDRCAWPAQTSDLNQRPAPLPASWLNRLGAPRRDGISEVVLTTAIHVAPKSLQWLWPERIAVGKLCIIAGEAGLGKSQISTFLAATVSTGGKFPSGEGDAPLGSVLLMLAEDDVADTVRPRLEVAGADLLRVHIIDGVGNPKKGTRPFDLVSDLQKLEESVRQQGDVRLIIIDPIAAFLRRGADVRTALTSLQELATKYGMAVVAITHLTKAKGISAMGRVQGPTAVGAVARNVFIVAREKGTDRRLLVPAKDNLGGIRTGLAFRIAPRTTEDGMRGSAVVWESGPIMLSPEALAATSSVRAQRGSLTDAEDFLRILLHAGPIAAREVRSEASEAGISSITLRRAAEALGVRSHRKGGIAGKGAWFWELPNDTKVIDAKLINGPANPANTSRDNRAN